MAAVEESPRGAELPPQPLPKSLTLASLPDLKKGHEGLLTEALSIIMENAIPEANEEARERARACITSYTFHQNHQRRISRNHYTALSQSTNFLEIPSFSHPPGT